MVGICRVVALSTCCKNERNTGRLMLQSRIRSSSSTAARVTSVRVLSPKRAWASSTSKDQETIPRRCKLEIVRQQQQRDKEQQPWLLGLF